MHSALHDYDQPRQAVGEDKLVRSIVHICMTDHSCITLYTQYTCAEDNKPVVCQDAAMLLLKISLFFSKVGCFVTHQEAYQSKPKINSDATTITTAVNFLAEVLSFIAFLSCTLPLSMFAV